MYEKVARISDVPSGSKKLIALGGQNVLLTNVQGSLYAINNRCPHLGGSLFDGRLEGDRIICPRHGATFDVKTGEMLQGAKIAFVKMNVRNAVTYPVKVEGEDILIDVG